MENMVNPDFWRGKKVFLTGHTGFKGSWISLWLQAMGAQVTGYALPPPTEPSLFEVARVGGGMRSILGDVRDLGSIISALRDARAEIAIHMAAQALVRPSYETPVDTYAVNVMGTVHLLEAVRCVGGVRAVLVITSDKCYENREWVWGYRENEPMGGHDPYSNSKGCAELVTSSYRRSFFYQASDTSIASARAGNVIGGGDWAKDRLIPDILAAFQQNRPVSIRNPHAIRPWQHVLEPLAGYLLLAQKLWEDGAAYGEGWNFGPNDEDAKSVSWIVEQLTKTWGEGASWVLDGGDHPHEAHYLKLDCSKAKARLGWHPRWDLARTVEKIVEWHKAMEQGENMKTKTLDQISQFIKGAQA